jgi:hypothetical protein
LVLLSKSTIPRSEKIFWEFSGEPNRLGIYFKYPGKRTVTQRQMAVAVRLFENWKLSKFIPIFLSPKPIPAIPSP